MKRFHRRWAPLFFIGLSLGAVNGAVTIVSDFTPVTINPGPNGANFNFNAGSGQGLDNIDDFNLTVTEFRPAFASLAATGLENSGIAVSSIAAPFPALQLQVGDSLGNSNSFNGNAGDMETSLLATEGASTSGEWAGGDLGYIGVSFEIAGATHFGFARVQWVPGDLADPAASSSFAIVDQIGYETVANQSLVIPVPEPSTALLSAFAVLALFKRKRV